jgi:hypothetical protein
MERSLCGSEAGYLTVLDKSNFRNGEDIESPIQQCPNPGQLLTYKAPIAWLGTVTGVSSSFLDQLLRCNV